MYFFFEVLFANYLAVLEEFLVASLHNYCLLLLRYKVVLHW